MSKSENFQQEGHFVSDSPPAYSDLGYNIPRGPTNTGHLEDEVYVSLLEVDQALSRNALHLDLSAAQKDTIRRLTESLLKRNVREQGVLPTSLQKQFTLEHVISKFNKPSRTGHRSNIGVETFVNSSSQVLTESPVVFTMTNVQTYVQQNQTETVVQQEPVITAPTSSNHGGRKIIGNWVTYTGSTGVSRIIHAYDDQIPRTINCMIIWMVIFFFIGSPFSLFCTIPAVYWIYQAKQNVAQENIVRAKDQFQKCYCMTVISMIFVFVFLVCVVTVIPVVIPLALT